MVVRDPAVSKGMIFRMFICCLGFISSIVTATQITIDAVINRKISSSDIFDHSSMSVPSLSTLRSRKGFNDQGFSPAHQRSQDLILKTKKVEFSVEFPMRQILHEHSIIHRVGSLPLTPVILFEMRFPSHPYSFAQLLRRDIPCVEGGLDLVHTDVCK